MSTARLVQLAPKPNGAAVIRFGKPRPLLPNGVYHAVCVGADWDWTKRYKRNQAKFVFAPPLDYNGPAYPGDLCALYPLAGKENYPYAASGGKFYALWSQANGSTPACPELSKASLKQMFEGRLCEIKVETVKRSWKAKKDEQDLPPELWYSVVREFRLAPSSQQPVQPLQPGNQHNQHNHLTFKPENKPCNQVTSEPPWFPGAADEGVSRETHAGSTTLGGAETQASNSVPRSQHCYVHGARATWWQRGEDMICGLCHPNPF